MSTAEIVVWCRVVGKFSEYLRKDNPLMSISMMPIKQESPCSRWVTPSHKSLSVSSGMSTLSNLLIHKM